MKSYLSSLVIGISIVTTAFIFANTYNNRNDNKKSISVTGLGSKSFVSDLIVWSGSFGKKNMNLQKAYALLDNDQEVIQNYMLSKGLTNSNMIFSAVDISKEFKNTYDDEGNYAGQVFTGYRLTQSVQIESNDVELVESISREISELINKGIEFNSQNPRYYYTKLAELKLEMIAEATKDANSRAKNIAINAESEIGDLKHAKMGVFQIVAQNSSESYSWGGAFNTTSKRKTASITMKLEYELE